MDVSRLVHDAKLAASVPVLSHKAAASLLQFWLQDMERQSPRQGSQHSWVSGRFFLLRYVDAPAPIVFVETGIQQIPSCSQSSMSRHNKISEESTTAMAVAAAG